MERRTNFGGAHLGRRQRVEDDLHRSMWPFGIEPFEHARMQFAEMPDYAFRSELQRAAAAGVEPGRAARHGLQLAGGDAERVEKRQGIAFGIERIRIARPLGPVPAAAHALRRTGAQTRRRDFLVLLGRAFKDLTDFKQR